jgi:isochorismate synthase
MQIDVTRTSAAVARARQLRRPVLASHTQPTYARDAIAFFTAAADLGTRALWLRPATGEALVGIGSAYDLRGAGPARFRQVADAWRNLVADALIDSPGAGGPLALGGFAFDASAEATHLWDGFPQARMVVPERLLIQRGGAAWLTTNVIANPTTPSAPRSPRHHGGPSAGLDRQTWQDLVGFVSAGIRDGGLGVRKVVLARAHDVRPTRSVDAALRLLAANFPTCTIFAIAHDDACFVGATPERLISLRDGGATTMALAGSAPRGATEALDRQIAERLLNDPKERVEHSIVVEALRDALAPLCERVVVDAEPRVRSLSNLQHLQTNVRGQVAAGRSVLDLVESLHPTPAVGGFPRARALELIRRHEALDRGWYSAPIGWMDARGDGEFVVGLRSALVRGEAATLFAGCGIVGGSDPATEYAEWGWKLRPMLAAFGADPP